MAPAVVANNNKKRALLSDSDSDSGSEDGGVALGETKLRVNEDFARRFEHNKKREEKQRLEEKFKASGHGKEAEDEDSSSDEDEDEDGFLATEDLDAQISATLQALRTKDPRVYDKDATFYQSGTDTGETAQDGVKSKEKKPKQVTLRDYHREKFMRGDVGASDDEEEAPPTYAQEQDALKSAIVSEIKAADADDTSDDDDDDDSFMLKKDKDAAPLDVNGVHPSRSKAVQISELDIAGADKDPETFLSNFMSARAWVPEGGPNWEAFESDDNDDDDGKAEEFEHAYNMRFEDPQKSNEVLRTYARDIADARSVRREEKTGRKRQRELEKERKEEEKRQRKEDKNRLRKLKLDEAEEKLKKVKQAAGAVGKELTDEDWIMFLDDAWENDKWEEEMQKRFGEDYYAMQDDELNTGADEDEDEADESGKRKKKHPKKPTWGDDIDIKDLVPDFEDDDSKPAIALSDDDKDETRSVGASEDEEEENTTTKKKKSKDHKRQRHEAQKQARQERARLEAIVDSQLQLTDHDLITRPPPPQPGVTVLPSSSSGNRNGTAAAFRYRETSPQSFGMTARDILLAPSDQALNQFAGLKKLASFRDEEKKRRDRKRLGKKARLRQWRKDNFGHEFERTGPTYGFEKFASHQQENGDADGSARFSEDHRHHNGRKRSADAGEGLDGDGLAEKKKKKRKRSKTKTASTED